METHSLQLRGRFVDQLQQRGSFRPKAEALSGDFFLVGLKLLHLPQSRVQVGELFREPGIGLLIVVHVFGPLVWVWRLHMASPIALG